MNKVHDIRLLIVVFAIIIWGIFIYFVVKDTESTSSPDFLEQNRVTVNVKANVLAKALSTRAAEWCSYDNAIWGDFTIESKDKSSRFVRIFLTDSIASQTARNYPHLFQYVENEDNILFRMKKYSFDGYVVVPAWLVEALFVNNILVIEDDKQNMR